MSTITTVMRAALRYARAGYKIIPCYHNPATGRKEPCHTNNWRGAASCDPKVIETWFKGEWVFGELTVKPEHILIGFPTGAANGVDVVDLDKKKDVDGHLTIPGWERLSQVISETPTGGHHLFYRHDPKLRLKNEAGELIYKDRRVILPGVDIRTTGGYVIVAGSTRPDGKGYSWHKSDLVNPDGTRFGLLTEPPIELLVLKVVEESEGDKEARKRRAKLELVEPTTLYRDRAHTFVLRQADRVAQAPEGTRDDTLKDAIYACASIVHAELMAEEQLFDIMWASVVSCGLDKDLNQHQVRKKVKDGVEAGKGTKLPGPLQERDWLQEMNKQFFILENEGGKCVVGEWVWDSRRVRQTVSVQKLSDFYNRFLHDTVRVGDDMVPVGKAWHRHRAHTQYHSLYFDPRGPAVDEKRRLNIWRGFNIEAERGNWQRLLGHVYRVLANRNPEVFRYMIQWSAWCFLNPEKPAEVALIMRGDQGTGKGMFARSMVKVFGSHGLQITKAEEIVGKFNGHLRGCCLLFADEAVSPRDTAAASVLKAMLSEDDLSFRDLYKGAVQDRNVTKIIMASNDAHVTHVERSDRRNAVFEAVLNINNSTMYTDRDGKPLWTYKGILNGRFPHKDDYFEWLNAHLKEANLAAMLFDLQNVNLGKWHPRYNIPETDAREEQRHLTSNIYVDVLADFLGEEEGNLPWMEVLDLVGIPISQLAQRHKSQLGQALREVGWIRRQMKERQNDGSRRSVYWYRKGESEEVLTAQELRERREARIAARQAESDRRREEEVVRAAENADRVIELFEQQQRDQGKGGTE